MRPSFSDTSFSPKILLLFDVAHPLVTETTKVRLHLRADLPLSVLNNGGFQIDAQAVLSELKSDKRPGRHRSRTPHPGRASFTILLVVVGNADKRTKAGSADDFDASRHE